MNADRLNKTFAALSDPTRRAILAHLTVQEANVQTLTAQFDLSQPAISKHLKVLETAGLVTREQRRQERFCRVDVAGLEAAIGWTTDLRARLVAQYSRLDGVLDEMKSNAEGGPTQ